MRSVFNMTTKQTKTVNKDKESATKTPVAKEVQNKKTVVVDFNEEKTEEKSPKVSGAKETKQDILDLIEEYSHSNFVTKDKELSDQISKALKSPKKFTKTYVEDLLTKITDALALEALDTDTVAEASLKSAKKKGPKKTTTTKQEQPKVTKPEPLVTPVPGTESCPMVKKFAERYTFKFEEAEAEYEYELAHDIQTIEDLSKYFSSLEDTEGAILFTFYWAKEHLRDFSYFAEVAPQKPTEFKEDVDLAECYYVSDEGTVAYTLSLYTEMLYTLTPKSIKEDKYGIRRLNGVEYQIYKRVGK